MLSNDISIKIADWDKDKNKLSGIRRRVFIEEQNVPEEMEWDEFDTSSIHFLVTLDGLTIACARLKKDGQIGRMAVLAEYRHQGIGRKLLQFVLQTAHIQAIEPIYLHAQVSAISFYERLGFTCQGEVFYEANIPHREMFKKSAK